MTAGHNSRMLAPGYSNGHYAAEANPLLLLGEACAQESRYLPSDAHLHFSASMHGAYDNGFDIHNGYPSHQSNRLLKTEPRPEFPTPRPLPSFALSNSGHELISPTSATACPRISRISSSNHGLGSYAASVSPRPNTMAAAQTSPHYIHDSYASPGPSRPYDPYSSSSPQPTSINTTPQSSYSELSDDRPKQRRRVMGMESTHSEPFSNDVQAPSRKGKKGRKFRKREGPAAVAVGSSSFTTFMVEPSPANNNEFGGAMYMATVDFNDDKSGATGVFEHGPTDLPPRPYMGGSEAQSPWKPRKNLGTIPGSALDYLPVVEDRMARLEKAIDAYVHYRGEMAVHNSIIPGLEEVPESPNTTTDMQLSA